MQVTLPFLQVTVLILQLTRRCIESGKEKKYSNDKKGETKMSEVIRVEHLKKYFNEVKAVDDISFSVERGELFGFLGVNGAGKSTTINMLCTLFPPTAGEVQICGYELGKHNERIKRHIGVVYQNNCLDKLLTVKENLMLRGSLYETDKKKLLRNMENICEVLELEEVMKRPYGKLSGGQKRRCEIATALLHTPDILFLDEPTTGLDPATRESVWSTLKKLQKEMDMTIFLTTHYMEEAARASHIAIMDKGHLVQYGTPFSLKEQFAKDKLLLVPKEEHRAELAERLEKRELTFKWKEERMSIPIADTMAALPLLEEFASFIEGFEVIQGTMDNVFLNVTGGQGE